MTQLNLSPLCDLLVGLEGQGQSGLIPALHYAQNLYGWIPEQAAMEIGARLKIPLADVYGVIEFYRMFTNTPTPHSVLRVCRDPACEMAGAAALLEGLAQRFGDSVRVERTTCLGLCAQTPAVHASLPPNRIPNLPIPAPRGQAMGGATLARIADLLEGKFGPTQEVVGGDVHRLTALCGSERATSLAAYEQSGGMLAFKKALVQLSPREVIEQVKASGLVGRGGAAFPTGLKWEGAAKASGTSKYLVINCDESEPGTFKDRVLMEGDPCRVLEGALLGAYAIGAGEIYVYIRGEYPAAILRTYSAIQELHQAGYLGQNILGSGFSVDFILRSGAGAYICGEETALFESLEGKRGFPRLKPPFPTTHGLFGKPTVINNVETLANIPFIIDQGPEIFRQIGSQKSPGSKLFCLSGDIVQPGLYEVPFGATLRHLLVELAGGVVGELQTVLVGGASGAFAMPADMDVPLTFEDLRAAGLPLGSGVIMVFNRSRDLRNILLGLAHFFAHESCGKCYPCQLGTQRQLEIMQRIAAGRTLPGDFERLQDVGWTMSDSSLCGLGQTAASAILSAQQHWPGLFQPVPAEASDE
jgi:NADH-quinone oxidoreductase subunit F